MPQHDVKPSNSEEFWSTLTVNTDTKIKEKEWEFYGLWLRLWNIDE